MHVIPNHRVRLVALGLMAAVSVGACAGQPAGSVAGSPSSQAPTSHVIPTTTATPSPNATEPNATPTANGGIQNLVISSAGKSELTAAYAASIGVPISDVQGAGPLPGETYYAYEPTTNTYWAMAGFDASATAPPDAIGTFQDRGTEGLFKKVGAGAWQVSPTGDTNYCGVLQFFPAAVLTAWALPTTP